MTVQANEGLEAPPSHAVPDLDSEELLGEFPVGPRLVGTRCGACGQVMIGDRTVCSACMSRDVVRQALPTTGVLYSFTRLHVGHETPRCLGYVDLDVGVRVLADIREGRQSTHPDMRVELGVDGSSWFFTPMPTRKGSEVADER